MTVEATHANTQATQEGPSFLGALARFLSIGTGSLAVILSVVALQDDHRDITSSGHCLMPMMVDSPERQGVLKDEFLTAARSANEIAARTPGARSMSLDIPPGKEGLSRKVDEVFGLYSALYKSPSIVPSDRELAMKGGQAVMTKFSCGYSIPHQ